MKEIEPSGHGMMWKNIKLILLGKRSQPGESAYYITPIM